MPDSVASAADRAAATLRAKHGATPFDARAHSMLELMDRKFAPMRWSVEDYVPEGTILVAGKPKSGKSWFVLNLMLSAVLGERFLKKPVVQSGGLYLALEDNDRRMQTRMRTLMHPYGDRMSALKDFEYRCDWPPGAEGAAALDEYLGAHPAVRIVAVDVLKNIRPKNADRSRNAYDLDYEAVEPWKQVAQARRVTLLIVHHTRKAEAEDAFDEISGTLGLNGVVDEMIVLRSVAGNHKQATAHFRGRDLEDDHELGLELKDGWWELIGSAREIASNEARKVVLEVMRDHGAPMTYDEQVAAFRDAAEVVGVHGAALAHVVLCAPGTRVLEIFHPLYATSAYALVANGVGLRYATMVAADGYSDDAAFNDPASTGVTLSRQAMDRDVRVDIAELARWLAMP